VFIVTPLLHFIGVCCHFLDALYWCSSLPPCCVMLVLINTSLLCFISARWHLFVVFLLEWLAPPLLCSIGSLQHPLAIVGA